ncbi:hypothetical protein T4E_11417 [Trichinella pseudospiralis]|uniref:Uncharacterized protein n=1 Tax=Trichinella pseudospiralis TaxID=6337 RepID=A0A0V0Y937_TRIPS|nr:hypothetical protein T4E_11417 [Trichinella pseudospiralis]
MSSKRSSIDSQRKIHRLLTTPWPNKNTAMNAFSVIERLVAVGCCQLLFSNAVLKVAADSVVFYFGYSMARSCGKQLMNRSNVPKETPVDWLWTPVLEKVIRQFHDKLLQHANYAMRLSALIP